MFVLKIFLYIILSIVSAFDILLLIRVICSWIISLRETKIFEFSYLITEPLLRPIRDALYRIEALRTFPLDLSVFVLFIMTNIVETLLSALIFYYL